jgi:hypothetical protein
LAICGPLRGKELAKTLGDCRRYTHGGKMRYDYISEGGKTIMQYTQTAANLFRYITQADLELYLNAGWDCRYIGMRGDELACFLASFKCCEKS